MTKDELIVKSAHYFDDKNIEVMVATGDGHFFHSDRTSKGYAAQHAKVRSVLVHDITRADVAEMLEKKGGKSDEPVVSKTSQEDQDIIDEIEKEEAAKVETSDEPKPKTKPNKGSGKK
tara:strand:+ start:4810 stop:5163 length:354 start_codon:yes stop_codon:yes gene_type:complete